jgi:hypothetical protein
VPFHSRFDPIKEGDRHLSSCDDAGFIVFLGLGAAYHLIPFLQAPQFAQGVVIEKNQDILRAILEKIDLRKVLMDPRLKILVDAEPALIVETLLDRYLPVLSGNLKTVSLAGRGTLDRDYYRTATQAIQTVIGRIADDYTVQSQFGKRWFINTLANLAKAQESTQILRTTRKVLITGAGPSLEGQIETLALKKKEGTLIASDTSLPALLAYGILPDLVISIDCQQITYHHFLQGYPRETPLIMDLASPPVLTRLADRHIFFSSAHPFSQYLTRRWRWLPVIDTSGGNVSHAALSLAALMESEEICLFGIDLSYPDGKSYARGTYLYPYFQADSLRTRPLETHLLSFLFRNEEIHREKTGATFRYITRPMISYKERLEQMIRTLDARVVVEKGRGMRLALDAKVPSKRCRMNRILSQGPAQQEWRDFLRSYKQRILDLPQPVSPLGPYWGRLSPAKRRLWMTQLPAAVAMEREFRNESLQRHTLLERAREWTLSVVERYV